MKSEQITTFFYEGLKMKKLNTCFNLIIEALKWPCAILMLILLIPAMQADMYVIERLTNMDVLIHFFLPFGATAILFLFMPALAGSFFAIMEHELTHMFFAVLTFHKPKGLDVNQDVGGSFSFEGKGNWLVALAPYFFPLFWFFLILLTPIYTSFTGKLPEFYLPMLGVFAGYNFIVSCLSIHPKQTDFKVAGYFFTICFLPGVLFLKYGMIFCYSIKGMPGLEAYIELLIQKLSAFL